MTRFRPINVEPQGEETIAAQMPSRHRMGRRPAGKCGRVRRSARWTTSSTARQVATQQTDAAVSAALLPICLAAGKADRGHAKKLGELTAMTSSYEQTEFVMKTGWATFPGQADPNRGVAEACASALLKTAAK